MLSRRARRQLHRADGVGGAGPQGRRDRAVVRGRGDRRPGQPARRRARRGDRGPGALAVGALPAAGRAVRHLLGDGAGARVPAARPLRPRRAEEDMKPDRTPLLLAAILAAVVLGGLALPQWLLFILTIACAQGLVVLGLSLLICAGRVSFGQALFYCVGAYTAGGLSRAFGVSDLFVQMLAGTASAALFAFVLGFLLARYRGIFFGPLSLALSMIFYGLIVKSETLGSTDGFNLAKATLLGVRPNEAWVRYALLVAAAGVTLAAAFLTHRFLKTPLGRLGPAITDNEIRVE